MMRSSSQLGFCSIDREGSTGVTWPCGAAPKGLCSPTETPNLRKRSIINGGDKKALTNEFPPRPGRVTLARLSETRNNGGYRMLTTTGTRLETPQLLRGNPLQVKFDAPLKTLARRLVCEGFKHHFSVIRSEIMEEFENLCRLLDIESEIICSKLISA